ncbi:MAG: S1C family serine protease, partial [Phycisphaerae bacterium]
MRASAFRTVPRVLLIATALTLCASASAATGLAPPERRADPQAAVLADEQARMDIVARLAPAVVCLLDEDRSGGGSGVVISPAGYGLTNFHVVAGMLKTRRGLGGLPDGRTYELKVLGIDPTGDLAMFRLSGKDRFDFVELGDSDTLRTGDWVLAMGNPFLLAEDFKPTVTLGIVSGLHRYQWGADGNQLVYTDCIQVDASINPGNSGGPLFDLHGRLIGINGRAAFEERGRVNVGLAFAISINQIKRFLPALQAGRLVEHASLGATVADAGYHNVVFDRVLEDSPAARSGIRQGDRLHAFAGRSIHSANQFANILGTLPAGWTVDIETSR